MSGSDHNPRNIMGFEIPLHRALTDPLLMAGASRSVTIVIGTLSAAIGLGLQLWLIGLLIWVSCQGAAVYLTAKDPDFMEVGLKHLRHKNFLGV